MAEKNVKKAEETQKAQTAEVEAQEAQAAPKAMTKADAVKARIEKQGYATDKDIAELLG